MRAILIALMMGLTAVNAMLLASADTEPNNGYATSELVVPGTYTGNLTGTDILDYYKVIVLPGQTLYANLTIPPKDRQVVAGDMKVVIKDYTDAILRDAVAVPALTGVNTTVNINWTTNSALPNGTFYVAVTNDLGTGGEGNYSLQVGIASQNEAGRTNHDAGEGTQTASSIATGTYGGYLKDTDGYDFYSLALTPGQTLYTNLTILPKDRQATPGDMKVQIIDYTGATRRDAVAVPALTGVNTTVGISWTTNSALPNGTFYVAVTNDLGTGGEGDYSLQVGTASQNDGARPNSDASEDYKNVTSLLTAGSYLGYLKDTDGYDFYSVALTPGQTLYTNLTIPPKDQQVTPGDMKVQIIDYTGAVQRDAVAVPALTGVNTTVGISWTTNSALPNGTFYVAVTNDLGTGGEGGYSLQVGTASQNDGARPNSDASEDYKNVTSLFTAGSYLGYLKDTDGYDFYSVALTPGQTLYANLTIPPKDMQVTPGDMKVQIIDYTGAVQRDAVAVPALTGVNTTVRISWTTNSLLSNGTFYVAVTNDLGTGGEGGYSLEFGTANQNEAGKAGNDAGDTQQKASPVLPAPLTTGEFNGYLRDTDKNDYYMVLLGPGFTVNATLFVPAKDRQVTAGNYKVVIYNSAAENKGEQTVTPGLTGADASGTLTYTAGTGLANYTFYLLVTNDLGTGGEGGYRLNLTIIIPVPDITPPNLTIVSPAGGATLNTTNVEVTVNASDNIKVEKVEVSTDKVNWTVAVKNNATGQWSANLVLVAGSNNIHARAFDAAGNNFTASIGVLVSLGPPPDTTKPVITVTSLSNNGSATSGKKLKLEGTATDNVKVTKVRVQVNGGTWTDATYNATTGKWSANVTLKEKKNTIRAEAQDAAGNSGTVDITVTGKAPEVKKGFIPGFEALAALGVLGAAAVLLRRRQ